MVDVLGRIGHAAYGHGLTLGVVDLVEVDVIALSVGGENSRAVALTDSGFAACFDRAAGDGDVRYRASIAAKSATDAGAAVAACRDIAAGNRDVRYRAAGYRISAADAGAELATRRNIAAGNRDVRYRAAVARISAADAGAAVAACRDIAAGDGDVRYRAATAVGRSAADAGAELATRRDIAAGNRDVRYRAIIVDAKSAADAGTSVTACRNVAAGDGDVRYRAATADGRSAADAGASVAACRNVAARDRDVRYRAAIGGADRAGSTADAGARGELAHITGIGACLQRAAGCGVTDVPALAAVRTADSQAAARALFFKSGTTIAAPEDIGRAVGKRQGDRAGAALGDQERAVVIAARHVDVHARENEVNARVPLDHDLVCGCRARGVRDLKHRAALDGKHAVRLVIIIARRITPDSEAAIDGRRYGIEGHGTVVCHQRAALPIRIEAVGQVDVGIVLGRPAGPVVIDVFTVGRAVDSDARSGGGDGHLAQVDRDALSVGGGDGGGCFGRATATSLADAAAFCAACFERTAGDSDAQYRTA